MACNEGGGFVSFHTHTKEQAHKSYQRILLSKYVIHGKYVILMQIWQYNADMARLYEIVGIVKHNF